MEIIFAKESGFCFGVERIVKTVENLAKNNEQIFTYGDLIHNKQELERLNRLGVKDWESENVKKGSIVLTRAHGITKNDMQFLRENYKVYDGTCPIVLAVRKIANDLKNQGYKVLITGSVNHPEIKSFLSFVEDAEVVSSVDDIIPYNRKIAIVSQTTFSFSKFMSIVSKAIELNKEVHVVNTICFTSMERQKEADEISKKVDFMIIIGGKHSSNTKKLFEVSSKNVRSIHIETESELKNIDFNGVKKIGIIAGASTPKWIVDKVVNKIKRWEDFYD
jgi:(E)-4-hydroxy-3-methyl-but-2-enyl pyrophosphate reductase